MTAALGTKPHENEHGPHPDHPRRQPAPPAGCRRSALRAGSRRTLRRRDNSRRRCARAVGDVVKRQATSAASTSSSDGEMSKISYATYIRHRLTGFDGDSARPTPQDLDDFPEYRDRLVKAGHSATYKRPVCKGPMKVKDLEPVKQDIARMKDAMAKARMVEGLHECRLARHHRRLSAQRILSVARDLSGRSRRRHARRVRADREIGIVAPARLPGPGHGPSHPLQKSDRRAIPPQRGAAGGGAESRARQCSRGSRAPARVLGQLRGLAHARHGLPQDFPDRGESQAAGTAGGGRESAA